MAITMTVGQVKALLDDYGDHMPVVFMDKYTDDQHPINGAMDVSIPDGDYYAIGIALVSQ